MTDARRPEHARAWLRRTLVGLVAVYVLLCAGIFLLQDTLLFQRTALSESDTERVLHATGAQPIELNTDGISLRGVLLPGKGDGPRPTVLYFGGNAERVRDRARDRGWVRELGFNLVLFSYRGYDDSGGSPSARALLDDAVALHDMIARRPDVDARRIVTWGTSLGTGVAARVARERDLAGTILAAPYTRLSSIAARVYPWLPVRWLFRHEIDTFRDAPSITEPLLVVHGTEDTLIPLEQGRRLVEAWGGPARLVAIEGANHNDLRHHPELREAVEAFLRERR